MKGKSKYLYCITRECGPGQFDRVRPVGNETGDIYAICAEGLTAVVSDAPEEECESSRANLLAHQRVIERVMEDCPPLPVRFGTATVSQNPVTSIERLLRLRRTEFVELLTRLEGQAEHGVKALWKDMPSVLQEVVAENAAINRLRRSLKGRSPASTHFDRIRLGEMIDQAVSSKRTKESLAILQRLRPLARQVVENPTISERMVVNAAFLVDRKREQDFDREVNTLDDDLGDRFTLRYVGPVPPFNFVNITVNWDELEETVS